jgi:DNA-directed RNA polymerase specialized sigma24 family protein
VPHQPERRFEPKLLEQIKHQLLTEVAVTKTQPSLNARTTRYATDTDFCRIFKEDMQSLYSLSLVLTADPDKAEQIFVSGLDDCSSGNPVFKEWAKSWARRTIIKNALRVIAPEPVYADGDLKISVAKDITDRNLPEVQVEISVLFGLTDFDRFAFVMSVLEGYSDHDCALLLGCTRQALVDARVRAVQEIARSVEIQPDRAKASFKRQRSGTRLSLPLATPA